jgi:hypothetical protein
MKPVIIAFGLSGALLAVSTDRAQAQLPYRQPTRGVLRSQGPPKLRTNNRPTVSPYVNLLSGRGIGEEYYGRVRPQQEFRRTATALGRSIQDLQVANQASAGYAPLPEIGTTGHAATFMSHSGYFNTGMSQGYGSSPRTAAAAPKTQSAVSPRR